MRRAVVGVFGIVCLLLSSSPPLIARAQEPPPERLILSPNPGSTFRVQAVYPNGGATCEAKRVKDLLARYRGRLEIVRQTNGRLALIDHLTFDEYLAGLAEMPRSWPIDALKAQVVAARTYAISQLERPQAKAKALGYDICSTDQCQVYRGLTIEQGAFGEAWVRAVKETRAKVLRYHGRPIQAYYFSTSSGRTKRSFPGGSPLPYLPSVAGQDDDAPLAHWTVRVPIADLGPILHSGDSWPGGPVESVRSSGDEVILSGSGHSVTLAKRVFRIKLNDEAACVFPDRYPTKMNGNKLPQTVPSIEFTMSVSGTEVVLRGRGWGHGVGMSQYGARSLAERGRSYSQILAYYYGGLRPVNATEPGAIRVLIAEGATVMRVGIEGSAAVTTGTGGALAPGDRFEVRGGKNLDVRRGIGPTSAPVLTVTLDSSEAVSLPPDGTVAVSYTLSGAARVTLVVGRDGKDVFRTAEVSQVLGPNVFSLSLDTSRASPTTPSSPSQSPSTAPSPNPSATAVAVAPTPLTAGRYELALEAYDGLDRVRTTPIALIVQERASSGGGALVKRSGTPVWAISLVVLIVIGGATTLIAKRRRERT
jgi:SpoIID/LytB domain protein